MHRYEKSLRRKYHVKKTMGVRGFPGPNLIFPNPPNPSPSQIFYGCVPETNQIIESNQLFTAPYDLWIGCIDRAKRFTAHENAAHHPAAVPH